MSPENSESMSVTILNEEECIEAQRLLDKIIPGTYELKTIYLDKWRDIQNPTEFGIRFKATVKRGLLKKISLGEKKSNNHQTYIIE
jgi:hypothetical protein